MKATSSVSRVKGFVVALFGISIVAACSAGSVGDTELGEVSAGLTKGTPGAVNGQADYCDDPANLCTAGEGDCDVNTQCTTGNSCAKKYGPRYGLTGVTDICMPASCRNNILNAGETGVDCGGPVCGPCYPNCSVGTNGSATFCQQYGSCLCGAGQGDCSATGECQPGLVCGTGRGAQFGFNPKTGLCLKAHCLNGVKDADEADIDCGGADCGTCLGPCTGTPGSGTFCNGCLCTAGQGDCDSNYECSSGLACGSKNGAQFGFASTIDVCVAPHCTNGTQDSTETGVDCGGPDCGTCPGVCVGTPGTETYCVGCRCAAGQGDCDSSGECVTGLTCGASQGLKFGFAASTDVCVAPHCTNGVLDTAAGETDVDCGGECGNCLGGALDAGRLHACAIFLGAVKCWGRNLSGQVGDGTTTDRSNPVSVSGLGSGFTLVAAGSSHACAVAGGNDVRCWGAGTLGQLGDGGSSDSLTPVSVSAEPASITQISAGGDTTCVLAGGSVYCWGDNSSGQVGSGSVGGTSTTPTQVVGITTAVHISVGTAHACAALADGTVRCWGNDASRQLGDNLRTNSGTPKVAAGVIGAIEVAANDEQSCALTNAGGAYCWGDNANDRLAIGSGLNGGIPSPVNGLTGAIHIASGGASTCAIKTGGNMVCWGQGSSGQVGSGATRANYSLPTAVTGTATDFAAISGGSEFFCAKNPGGIYCWGDDTFGELGKGTIALRDVPTNVASGPTAAITHIADGDVSSCAVAGGVPYCWGSNNSGELGDGTDQQRRTPKAIAGISNASQVAAGSAHGCAMLSTGGVRCWGSNTFGQLGNGTTTSSTSPVVTSISNVAHIGAGTSHVCGQLSSGAVQCWGRSDQGQLGNGSTTQSTTPVTAVAGGVVHLAVGQRHNCVALNDGSVQCWGTNNASQIGDGTTTNQPTPVPVSGLPANALLVATGQLHSCAVLAGGTVYCWGDNAFGQLGDSTFADSPSPVQVTGLTGVTAIETWGSHTCALKGNALYCWGQGGRGQIGNGSIANAGAPVVIAGSYSLVGTGGRHTCALRTTSNTLRCWGYNDYGQVGDSTAWLFPTPAAVAF